MAIDSEFAAVPAEMGVIVARILLLATGGTTWSPLRCSGWASKAIAGGLMRPVPVLLSPVGSAFPAVTSGLPLVVQPVAQFRISFSPRASGSMTLSVKRFTWNNLGLYCFAALRMFQTVESR